MSVKQEFDYVIIGSGASGSVIANRLSANDSNRVLVLEAGGPADNADISAPGGFTKLWGSDLDWQLTTVGQPGLGNREMIINQGKVAGGSTSINAMMYVRGNRRNYDMWSNLGADGWAYDDVLPYFKKSEDFELGESEYHGAGGPLHVRVCPDQHMRSEPFLLAAKETGFDGPYTDTNGEKQEDGAGLLQFHIADDGRRASAATAFLQPVLDRRNLSLQFDAQVTRIVVEDDRAVGVDYVQAGEKKHIRSGNEVILSAGALHTPKLLQLSGIGAADDLKSHGIDIVADLPGVGQNLQDHVQLPVIYRTNVAIPNTILLTGNVLFVRTSDDADDAPPDLQLNFTPSAPEPLLPMLPDFGGPVCIFLPILVQPTSRGNVSLRSANPLDKPLINPDYLGEEADYQVFVKALDLIRSIAKADAFSELNGGELAPGDGDPEGYIRSQASTLWHPAGTCKIGSDALSVVDPRLRVHGVKGLRVADASVMPTVTSGNTVAACFMIGEKAADMIMNEA